MKISGWRRMRRKNLVHWEKMFLQLLGQRLLKNCDIWFRQIKWNCYCIFLNFISLWYNISESRICFWYRTHMISTGMPTLLQNFEFKYTILSRLIILTGCLMKFCHLRLLQAVIPILSWVTILWNIFPPHRGNFNSIAFISAVFNIILFLFVDQIFKFTGL